MCLQENAPLEDVERQYSQLYTQIVKLKKEGEILLMGDFNSNLNIEKENAQQNESRNGKLLQNTLNELNLTAISIKANAGTWTRVNRNNPSEKSITDYIIVSETIKKEIRYINIDEEGTLRLKRKIRKRIIESDHNTIAIETDISLQNRREHVVKWNLSNTEGWKKYNELILETTRRNPPQNHDQLERVVNAVMAKTVGKVSYHKDKYNPKLSDKAKAPKTDVKRLSREVHQAIKRGTIMTMYIETQNSLRKEIEISEKNRIEAKIKHIVQEGGSKSNRFWQIR